MNKRIKKHSRLCSILIIVLCLIISSTFVPLSTYAGGPAPVEPLLDFVPASLDSPSYRDYGEDYNTAYTVMSGINYSGSAGSVLQIPYTATMNLSELETKMSTFAGSEPVSSELTFSFNYDANRIDKLDDSTKESVQLAINGCNPAGSFARLYEVSELKTESLDSDTNRVEITLRMKDGVTADQVKDAFDISSKLLITGKFITKVLTEADSGKVYTSKVRIEGEVEGSISGSFEVETTTADSNQIGNTDPGFAYEGFSLAVTKTIPKTDVKLPVDLIPTIAGNMTVSNSTEEWYNGHTKDGVNSGAFGALKGEVGYTSYLNMTNLVSSINVSSPTGGGPSPTDTLSGDITNSFTFDTSKLTANTTKYASEADLINALYTANAANGLNSDPVPTSNVKIANLFEIKNATITGDKVEVKLGLKSGVTVSNLPAGNQTIVLKTPDDMFTANMADGDIIWAENGKLNGTIKLNYGKSNEAHYVLTSGTLNGTGVLDTSLPASEKFVAKAPVITPAEVKLTGKKTLDGQKKTSDITAGQFTFNVLSGANNNATGFTGLNTNVSVKAGGDIDFGTLSFTKAGTYTFTITENNLGKPGYTYDQSTYEVKVVVTLNANANKMESVVTMTKQGNSVSSIDFANSYMPTAVKSNVPVEKVIKGNPTDVSNFTFVLKSNDNNSPMPKDSTNGVKEMTIKGAGNYDFGDITFIKAGTYTYSITEKNDGVKNYTYDTTTYTVKYVVTDNNGKLEVVRTISDSSKTVNKATFTNSYEEPSDDNNPTDDPSDDPTDDPSVNDGDGSGDNPDADIDGETGDDSTVDNNDDSTVDNNDDSTVNKTVNKNSPDTGDNSSMEFWITMSLLSSVCISILGFLSYNKRKKYEE